MYIDWCSVYELFIQENIRSQQPKLHLFLYPQDAAKHQYDKFEWIERRGVGP